MIETFNLVLALAQNNQVQVAEEYGTLTQDQIGLASSIQAVDPLRGDVGNPEPYMGQGNMLLTGTLVPLQSKLESQNKFYFFRNAKPNDASKLLLRNEQSDDDASIRSNVRYTIIAQCLKITQNVAFEFLNFGIFHQLNLTCLVTLFDRKLQVFKNSPKMDYFWHF